jgi:Na+/H+-translocating membrane pyrophosphatase
MVGWLSSVCPHLPAHQDPKCFGFSFGASLLALLAKAGGGITPKPRHRC